MNLYFRDLPCYQNLKEEQMAHKLYTPNSAFHLDRLPNTALKISFAAFIFDRASTLSFLSLSSEQEQFHNLADFLTDTYPALGTLTDIPQEELERKLKTWILKTGKNLTYRKKKMGRITVSDNPVITYMKKAYTYFLPHRNKIFSKEDDIWDLKKIPIHLRASPSKNTCTLNFSKIQQEKIKQEVKECCFYRLKRNALATVMAELSAVNYLAEYLFSHFPQVASLNDINRTLLEEYLSYLYLESRRKKDYRSELCHLKTVLNTSGRLFSYEHIRGIFLKSDFAKQRRSIYRCYSEEELKRLHDGYRFLDKQTARLLLIHELLGLRISDTLTIKKEDLTFGDHPKIKVTQQKTGKTFEKKLNNEVLSLLKASIEDTTSKYGDCEYIFVSDKDKSQPLSYATLYYRMSAMIFAQNLRDDNGMLFSVGTHLFRHTYGKKLCDLQNDDATIAALLGHASLSSVANYRKMSPATLAKETKTVIDERNNKIKQFKKGWMA